MVMNSMMLELQAATKKQGPSSKQTAAAKNVHKSQSGVDFCDLFTCHIECVLHLATF